MAVIDQFVRGYLRKIVKAVVPFENSERVLEELVNRITRDTNNNNGDRFHDLNEVLLVFQSKIPVNAMVQLQSVVEQLLRYQDQATTARYLFFLDSLIHSPQNASTPRTNDRASFYGDNASVQGRTVDSFENINFDQFSDRKSIYSAANNYHQDSTTYTFQELLIPYFEGQIPDTQILKYLPYTLAGTYSDLFPLDGNEIKLPSNINNSTSGILHQILESGLIYQRLSNEIEAEKSQNRNISQTRTAVLSFIQEELVRYLNLINILSNRSDSSLRLVQAELLYELTKLRFLHFIQKSAFENNGHQILSFLHSYTTHGDQLIREVAIRAMSYCLTPFSEFIYKWLVDAEIVGNGNEFFIKRSSKNDFSSDLNDLEFLFVNENVPSFFNKDLSSKVYNIGSTIFFLKFHCKEIRWCNTFSEKAKSLLQNLRIQDADSTFWSEHDTIKTISNLHDEIQNYFTFIIYQKFSFFDIVVALNDYLLMSKGDFIQSIIEDGKIVLGEPSNSLSGHQLTNLLRDAVLKTTSRYSKREIIDNLDARLLAVGHGNIGWDVFTLDYRVESPLALILNNKTKDQKKDYLRVFNHLWKIKRLNYLFCEVWKENKQLRSSTHDKKYKRLLLIQNFLHGNIKRVESFILNQIINFKYEEFVSKLKSKNNLIVEVVQNSSNDFKLPSGILKPDLDYLNGINDIEVMFQKKNHGFNEYSIDELKNLHSEFLSSIIKHKLINGSNSSSKGKISKKHYVNQLNNLINLSFRFGLAMKELQGLKAENESGPDVLALRRETTIYQNLLKLFNEFNGDLKVFVTDLSNDDDLELRYLGVSLNQ